MTRRAKTLRPPVQRGGKRPGETRRGPGVRISGGELRGRLLRVPDTARPTGGRVREALFSIWMEELPGARVLDLFAGSGAVALEAASRGAGVVVAVEGDPEAFDLLEDNVATLSLRGLVETFRGELPGFLARLREDERGPFDLVFADPPYAFEAYEELLRGVAPLLAGGGEVAVEHSSRTELPPELSTGIGPLVKTRTRRYGESSVSFYRRLDASR